MSYIALLIKKESKQREHALKHHHHHSLRVLVYKIIQKIRLNKANPRRNCYVCMEQLQCILLHHYVLNSLLSTAPTLVKSFSLMWGMKMFSPDDVRRPSEVFYRHNLYILDTHPHKIGYVYSYIADGSENVLNLLNGSEAVFFYQSVGRPSWNDMFWYFRRIFRIEIVRLIFYTVCENWPHSGH